MICSVVCGAAGTDLLNAAAAFVAGTGEFRVAAFNAVLVKAVHCAAHV
jgi:hypothetical protein